MTPPREVQQEPTHTCTKDHHDGLDTRTTTTTPTMSSSTTPTPQPDTQELQQQQHQPQQAAKAQQHYRRLLHPSTVPMIGGFMGGVVSTTLLLPLDIVKLRLQVSEKSTNPDPNRKYRHFRALRIFGGIVKYEGIFGLYQGLTPAVLGSSISWGGYFFFYENFKQSYIQYKRNRVDEGCVSPQNEKSTSTSTVQLSSLDNFVLACMSGAIMVALTNPIWLIKTRMQLQMKRAQQQQQQQQQQQITMNSSKSKGSITNIKPYDNMVDAVRTIIREEGGIAALYKGSGPALLLTSHGGVQFVVYEYLRKRYQPYFIHPSNHDKKSASPSTTTNSGWVKLQQSAGYLTMGAIAKM
jgi:Mitochondrial carrier protein